MDNHRDPNVARNLLLGWRWFDDRLRQRLNERGFGEITSAQSMVFPFLDHGGTRPTVLADRMNISRQAVHQLLLGLNRQGLVELVTDPTSKRSKLARLTERGQESLVVAQESLIELEEELNERVGHKDGEALKELLQATFETEQQEEA